MKERKLQLCCNCKQREVERIDEFVSTQCSRCNDRDYERYLERLEFEFYHREDKSP